jgi:hypothetical protein
MPHCTSEFVHELKRHTPMRTGKTVRPAAHDGRKCYPTLFLSFYFGRVASLSSDIVDVLRYRSGYLIHHPAGSMNSHHV